MPSQSLHLDGLTDLPPGKIAAIVTFLELREAPAALASRPGLKIRRLDPAEIDTYRELFARIGEKWLWFSRLVIGRNELGAILAAPSTTIEILEDEDGPIGLAETVRQGPGETKIAFFGVVERAQGTGAAQYLMRHTLRRLQAEGIARIWLHTCTFDHPAAMRFYLAEGFRAFRIAIEVADDPRLLGLVPRDAAWHVPVIAGGEAGFL